jgi:hypothetical protein
MWPAPTDTGQRQPGSGSYVGLIHPGQPIRPLAIVDLRFFRITFALLGSLFMFILRH